MCGRTACTLAPDDVCRACTHTTKNGKVKQPKWQDPPGGQKYYTSYNVAPGSHTPVLLSRRHFTSTNTKDTTFEHTETISQDQEKTDCHMADSESEEAESEWVVQPMHWGLVPFWSAGETKVGYSMINTRSETMLSKRSFKVPLEKGRRCVVLVDGYFEWQTKDGKKQPYFLYFPHAASESVDELNKQAEVQSQETVFTGRRVLTLAGLFDVCHPKNGDPPLYSYSIITVEASDKMSWLHERMPAVLDGEAEVQAWLDSGSVPLTKAIELIHPHTGLHYHPVSSIVGNVKNKSDECVKPFDIEKEKKKQAGGSSSLMASWLSKGKKRSIDKTDPEYSSQPEDTDSRSTELQSQEKLSPEKKQKTT